MSNPLVACEHCRGTGRRELTYVERLTIDAIRHDSWSTSAEIADRLERNVTIPALCNRLVALRALSLVERRWKATNARIAEWRRI